MTFTELNSVENYIIHQLSGMNLNAIGVEEKTSTYGTQWAFKSASELNWGVNEVLVELELREALIRLNPAIAAKNELADEVIYKLRAIFI